mmetsp:Transcript_66/g.120  ORF Transcript_66/g.120 Transcript_66/m.120 type:complete len:753 (+) Transcript_66:116-2374(+)|eukprot:CAMPEP_0176500876 /NCGR_PEP_ID=MMETSP0200_2-20121128/13833_1 /TAXON_ID=947934 /ORGANISM="Chaetoceros sp., Strain GSL56" /LENGTH=752 /DNA_ID=CAMNT_0017899669 /DNA_START=41 /DNA_END=2299 /DNA_ORIENTATION=-
MIKLPPTVQTGGSPLMLCRPVTLSKAIAPMSIIIAEKIYYHEISHLRPTPKLLLQQAPGRKCLDGKKKRLNRDLFPRPNKDFLLHQYRMQLVNPWAGLQNRDVLLSLSSPFGQRIQTRKLSVESKETDVSDEESYNCILRKREMEMHRHPAGPVARMTKLSRDALKGGQAYDGIVSRDIDIIDLESSPPDLIFSLARDFSNASLKAMNTCSRDVQSVADGALDLHLPNVMVELSKTFDLSSLGDNSVDLVTSCFSLQKFTQETTGRIINDIHRVLKPGGTLVVCVWEHLGSDNVLTHMMENVLKVPAGDYIQDITTTMKPHVLEKIITSSGLSMVDIERGEYPFYLSTNDESPSCAFDLVSLPIKDKLGSLMSSGERPYAFEDARAAFDEMVSKGIIRKGPKGYAIDENRYKIIVARRKFEDDDTAKKVFMQKSSSVSPKATDVMAPVTLVPLDAVSQFDELLSTSLSGDRYSPMSCFESAVKHAIKTEGHDIKKLNILDLGSRPARESPTQLLREAFPDAKLHSANFIGSLKLADDMKSGDQQHLDIGVADTKTFPESQLSNIPDASVDIVMSAFGLHYFEDPNAVIRQVHRVLKPGGSFITTTWDRISLEAIANCIMTKVIGEGHAPYEFLSFSRFAAPHELEKLIHYGGLGIVKSEHHEFPFVLAKDGIMSGKAFEAAILPVHNILSDLEESGTHPNAIADARKAFDEMVENGELVSIDKHGCLITDPNRFNLVIARRLFEDSDGLSLE